MEDSKIILVKITSWEANGYDDSDWDTIYYNVDNKSILHDFGTTRGYTTSSLPTNSEVISLDNAVSSNIVTEKEVRDAFAKDTFKSGKVSFSTPRGQLPEAGLRQAEGDFWLEASLESGYRH